MQEPIVTFPQSPMQSPRNQKSMIRQSQDILDDSREIANIYEHQWRHPRHPNCLSCNNGCLVKHNSNSDRFTMFCTNPACHLFFENNSSYFGPKTPLPPPDTHSKIQTFIILIAVVVFLGVFLSGIMNTLFGRH